MQSPQAKTHNGARSFARDTHNNFKHIKMSLMNNRKTVLQRSNPRTPPPKSKQVLACSENTASKRQARERERAHPADSMTSQDRPKAENYRIRPPLYESQFAPDAPTLNKTSLLTWQSKTNTLATKREPENDNQ